MRQLQRGPRGGSRCRDISKYASSTSSLCLETKFMIMRNIMMVMVMNGEFDDCDHDDDLTLKVLQSKILILLFDNTNV